MTADLIQKTFIAKADGDDPLEYVMSDATVDRMGDVIEPDGWKLGNFKKNPIALMGHDKNFIVGNWSNVRIEKAQLRGRLNLIEAVSDRLREVVTAVKAGIIRAVSVGFRPLKAEALEGSKNGGVHFLEQELVECSLAAVGANPNALQIAKELNLLQKATELNLSSEAMTMIFGKNADEGRAVVREMSDAEFTQLRSLDEWHPAQARKAKLWMAEQAKMYPFNPLYRKMHRLMEEIECVRTVDAVFAEHGIKKRAS